MRLTKILTLFITLFLTLQFAQARPPENATQIMEHLEILGYDVNMDTKHIKARHKKYLNIFLKKYRDGILVTAFFGSSKYAAAHRDAYLRLVNKLNRDAAAARYYVDKQGDLRIEGYYPGPYHKKNFTAFIDTFNLEKANLSDKLDTLKKFLK